jgi:structural maintenance of chromosome 4
VAITTACPGLDSLVVDTVETAEKCIDYLKKNGIGRARFICLDRQRNPSRIEIPEGMERLFDLVQPKDEKFGPAFYHAIGNTLVAKDLSQASRFAYGKNRRRIVTLNGELIEASGLMSGGGNRARKGGMSSKLVSDVTKDQVVKFEHDRDSLDREFAELQTQQRELETILRRLNDQLPQMDTKVQKLAMEVESFDHSIVDAERRIAELRAEKTSTGADKNRISELEKTIAIREEEKSNLEAEIAGAEAEIKGLEGKISQIGGAKLRSQKAKVDGLREQIQTIITMKSQAEESKSTEEKQFAKHEKDANSADQELEKLAIESTKVEEALQAHSNNATNIRQEAEEAQEVSAANLLTWAKC